MKEVLNETQQVDYHKAIERAVKKYTLEVDDAIEAHGFKATSYIDYAEDSIQELENSIKKQFEEKGSLLFTNLMAPNGVNDNVSNTVGNIISYTKETAYGREMYGPEKIDLKINQLDTVLGNLSEKFIQNLENM